MTARSITCIRQESPLTITRSGCFDPLDLIVELSKTSPNSGGSSRETAEQIRILLSRAQLGGLLWNRDVKRLKLVAPDDLFELRLSLDDQGAVWGLRIFFVEDATAARLTLIGSHLKNPKENPSQQREAQNLAIADLFQRYMEIKNDNL